MKPGSDFQQCSQRTHTGCVCPSSSGLGWHVGRVVSQGSSLQTEWPGLSHGAGHGGMLCPACVKLPHSQKERSCSAQTVLFVQTAEAQ